MNEHPWSSVLSDSAVRISVLGVLAILALFLVAETLSVSAGLGRSGVPATDTITVQGDGKATMPPDVAHVSFAVQNSAKTVADAQAATTKQAGSALDFVKGQGVAEKDVKTLSYNITPQYSYQTCPAGTFCPSYSSKVTGYEVSETVQVTVRDLASVGALLEGLGGLSVQNVSGPDFALDDPAAGYDAAREDAIAKAKSQAAVLAKQLGVRLGKIVNFSETSGGYPQTFYGLGGATLDSAKAAAPVVPVGENTYNASVSITYELR